MPLLAGFETALDAYACGNMSLEQVLALADDDRERAAFIADQKLHDFQFERQADTNRIYHILELLWVLNGSSKCLSLTFAGFQPESVVVGFLRVQLDSHPQFSDEDLQMLHHFWGQNSAITATVSAIQQHRMIEKAKQMLSVPRELSKDVEAVKARVSEYHFTPELNSLLGKVEDGLGKGDAFDQKALLTHLRTFFEKLHREAAERLHQHDPALKDGTDLTQCQNVIDYLQRKDLLTEKMKALGRALYGVLSNEGVHAIKSESEYVRLCRNMVAEYALILFFELGRALGK